MKTIEEIENKIYEIITHNGTSECHTKLVALFNQALSQHEEEAYQRGCKDTEEAFGWQCEKFIEKIKS